MIKNLFFIPLAAIIIVSASFPFERFANYTSTRKVSDFAFQADTVWAATSGGLFRYVRSSGSGTLFSNPSFFPDPSLTALCLDSKNNLWIGSERGYLTLRPAKGSITVYSTYATAGWQITDLATCGDYLIVASDKGCSIFDTKKKTAIKNAAGFTTIFQSPKVYAIGIFSDPYSSDSLLLGCEKGVAKLSLANNNLEMANFYDPGIWSIDSSANAPVKAFAIKRDGYKALTTPGTAAGSRIVSASSELLGRTLLMNGSSVLILPDSITAIAARNENEVYIGTNRTYFHIWDGTKAWMVPVDGPSFTKVNRVFVDHEGITWVCPEYQMTFLMADQGISSFENGKWRLFNPAQYPQMGERISAGSINGVAEDQMGRMWFGTFGAQVKRYTRSNDAWEQFCVGAVAFGQGKFFSAVVCSNENPWAWCNAIARDSTGYLWFASYNNYFGSLLCYDPGYDPVPNATDPASNHYRFFFPLDDPDHSKNIGVVCVDRGNAIIAADGAEGNGRIQVFKYTGNPLTGGLTVKADFNDQRGIAYDAATTADTLTYIATSTGFYTFFGPGFKIRKGLCIRSWNNAVPLTILDSTLANIQTVEVEDERFLWLGTASKGLIRYDLLNNSSTVIDESVGLLSNDIQDLCLDRKNGALWIATDRGVSRYSLGYSVGRKNEGIASIYPNPFSKRRHLEVVFEKLPPLSTVLVYTVSGSLITTLFPLPPLNAGGSTCVWKPSKNTVPGIYLYIIRSSGKPIQGKLIVTP
jgi:ligand-binding sensor domain-containing protein